MPAKNTDDKFAPKPMQDPKSHSAQHATFVIDRHFDATPAQVFKAFADEKAKSLWFGGTSDWDQLERKFEFRVGGHERLVGKWKSGRKSAFDAYYHDIVPSQRIVYAYHMHIDDRLISVSLATIELTPDGDRTRMKLTEQGAFLDGYDDAGSRETGTRHLLQKLAESLSTS
ncbi:MAG: SRPBCC family protein [Rudaea sp.]